MPSSHKELTFLVINAAFGESESLSNAVHLTQYQNISIEKCCSHVGHA